MMEYEAVKERMESIRRDAERHRIAAEARRQPARPGAERRPASGLLARIGLRPGVAR
jgi:hypothetical protein